MINNNLTENNRLRPVSNGMKILIATGIYPPEIGGPAQYALNLFSVWEKQGHKVSLSIFSKWNFLPTGIRHLAYFFSIISKVWQTDLVLILDTFSCAFSATILGILFGKKIILRTGGDFLWEGYVERTDDLVLLSEFYKTRLENLNRKEKIIFWTIRHVLQSVDMVVFSTKWQEKIFWYPYGLQNHNTSVIENYYGPKINLDSRENFGKEFIASTRKLKWKNITFLEEIFKGTVVSQTGAGLYTKSLSYDEFLLKINNSYAVILASLGDISPNMILDAIRLNKPFIMTKETGISDRVSDAALFVDPENKRDIQEKILWLLNPENYEKQVEKIKNFSFVHTWEEIASEFLDLYKSIK